MGPGPSEVPDAVLKGLATPLLGHLDPDFLSAMDRVQEMLRTVFQTKNRVTFPMSGTGSAGMETCLSNLLEPGDSALIGVNGVFGTRMIEMAERCGARVITVEAPWGEILPEAKFCEAISRERPKVVALVHAETSTGVGQPVVQIAQAAHDAGSFIVLDCVTSLGGCPVEIDAWGIDAAYSATQKCLSCPPGLAPVTFSERAMQVVQSRKNKVRSWYLDVGLIAQYWGKDRLYHHTAPISMNFALHEALRLVLEEGLERRFARHKRNHEALKSGITAMGLSFASQEGHRLWMLNTIRVPDGINEAEVRKSLLSDHGIEIGGGMGQLKGKIWRVGLMGASSSANYVVLFLAGLSRALKNHGFKLKQDGTDAAEEYYRRG